MSPARFAGLVTVIVAVGLVAVLASRFGDDPRVSASPLIGAPAPDLRLRAHPSGEVVGLGDFDGSIVVVNFWASWCGPCRLEHEDLLAIAAGYGSSVTVVGVVFQDDPQGVDAFLDRYGRGYPIVFDENSAAAIAFGVRGVPETFFIDAHGIIAAKVSGPINEAVAASTLYRMLLGQAVEDVTTGTVQQVP